MKEPIREEEGQHVTGTGKEPTPKKSNIKKIALIVGGAAVVLIILAMIL